MLLGADIVQSSKFYRRGGGRGGGEVEVEERKEKKKKNRKKRKIKVFFRSGFPQASPLT